MKAEILELKDGTEEYQLQAWRICRAWKQILGIKLAMDRVAKQLRDMDKHLSAPTPLADKVLAEMEQEKKSKLVVLAELKEPGGNWAREGGAYERDSTSTLESSVFEE
jgi:hypothetical protein